jgi:flagellar hook-associated protein 1 FlgK
MNAIRWRPIRAGITGTYSVSGYAESSIGWLESLRSRPPRRRMAKRHSTSASKSPCLPKTGVNIDEEMAILVELEQSYQASARIVRRRRRDDADSPGAV